MPSWRSPGLRSGSSWWPSTARSSDSPSRTSMRRAARQQLRAGSRDYIGTGRNVCAGRSWLSTQEHGALDVKTRLTRVSAIVGVIGFAPLAAAQAPIAAGTRTPAIFATPTPTATPAPGGEVTNPAEAVKKSLEEGHEKSKETLKGAAGAVKEGAGKAAEGAKEAVENAAEAAKEAAEAAAAQAKEAALDFRTDMHHWPERVWVDIKEVPSVRTAVVLGLGAGLAGLSSEKWDDKIRRNVAKHPERFGSGENK